MKVFSSTLREADMANDNEFLKDGVSLIKKHIAQILTKP